MQIRSESRIKYPRDQVYAAYRDRLPEIAGYIPDIKEIVVKSRAETPDGVRLHNEWVADRDIPGFAQAILKPEHLRWDDHAEWHDGEHFVAWRLETRAFTEAVRCAGRNTFVEDGAGTKVLLTGELTIDLKEIPGVPSFLAKRIAPQVEKFIVSLITPNLEKVNASIERFLDVAGWPPIALPGPRADSVTVDGADDGFVVVPGWMAEGTPTGDTRLVVSVPFADLPGVHEALVRVLGAPLGFLYRRKVDRRNPGPQNAPPKDFVALTLDPDRVIEALRASAVLVYSDARGEVWIRGRMGEQVVLDEDGLLYCYPDDPSFRDALGAAGVPGVDVKTVAQRDYVKHWFRAEADEAEDALLRSLRLTEVKPRSSG